MPEQAERFDADLTDFVLTQQAQELIDDDLRFYVKILSEGWADVRYTLDEELYRRAYDATEALLARFDLVEYFRVGDYDAIAVGMDWSAIALELNASTDLDRFVFAAVLLAVTSSVDDVNYQAWLKTRDLLYPFEPEIHSQQHRYYVQQLQKMMTYIFESVKEMDARWYDLLVDTNNFCYLAGGAEQAIQAKKRISLYAYNYYRIASSVEPYSNVLQGFILDEKKWYSHDELARTKTFEMETTLLFCYGNDALSYDREDKYNEVVNSLRLVDPESDHKRLLEHQLRRVMVNYAEISDSSFAKFLYRQVKLAFAWHLISSRYFPLETTHKHRAALADIDSTSPPAWWTTGSSEAGIQLSADFYPAYQSLPRRAGCRPSRPDTRSGRCGYGGRRGIRAIFIRHGTRRYVTTGRLRR